ncbi:hypothetical protein COHA_010442 [Chlorella ohadii]|uniref:Tyrosine specific protein phosphatases domain-containing protein n=1 Tax=Chlorella ohadii TaxID=2649997 RepID=A0AAD5DHR1_9CHLO|nr:hypothetical protein COHA_010442 [Chlorella ohadii]
MASAAARQPSNARAAPASSRELLGSFQPGSEAEPPGLEPPPADTTPTVLNKLQKWADYAAVGTPVWPTKFIPMKTPMSREILDNWSLPGPPKHPLTVPLLLEGQAAQGRTVGLIIDLANHDCLYSDDVPDTVEYEHVQLIAKVLPSREAIDEVERIARSFWSEQPNQYIAIHCAYGFNRTGFVVCSYLCQACGLSVEQALESFAAARPPGVKHEKFIRELYARYGTASQVPTPEGSVAATSPPEGELAAVDALAAEAERLLAAAASAEQPAAEHSPQQPRQQGAPAAGMQQQRSQQASPAAGMQQQRSQQASPALGMQQPQRLQPQRPQQQGQRQQRRRSSEDEPPHFEDAADSLRHRSMHRQHSRSADGSTGGSRNASLHGAAAAAAAVEAVAAVAQQQGQQSPQQALQQPAQQPLQQQQAGAGQAEEAEEGEVGVATTAGAPETFLGSRRLLQRKHSRGGSGGLALALSRQSIDGSSPGGSGSGSAAACGSPMSQSRTARSSYSDFAAAAQHLEGANSMRRSTSLGLAK